jgi:hypothetical protein
VQNGTDQIDVTGLSGELADPQPPKAHKTLHELNGADEIDVTGLSGELADPQKTKPHAASHAPTGGDPLTLHQAAGIAPGALVPGDLLRWDGTGWRRLPSVSGSLINPDLSLDQILPSPLEGAGPGNTTVVVSGWINAGLPGAEPIVVAGEMRTPTTMRVRAFDRSGAPWSPGWNNVRIDYWAMRL